MSMRLAVILIIGCGLALSLGTGTSQAQPSITVTPSGSSAWTVTITANDLVAPGSDLPDVIESSHDHTSIEINFAGGWEVLVRREDTNWPSGLELYVVRTGDGSTSDPTGWINGGGNPGIEVTGTDKLFFEGSGDRTGIHVQLAIRNLSLEIPPGYYSTTLIYTVLQS